MLQFILVLIIGYFIFKLFYKYIMPVIKLCIIFILCILAIKTETLLGYSFVGIACLYYVVSIIRWLNNLKKDDDGNYIIHY